ncbi:hypothetical protein HUU62_22475, partial [Rhodoferax sp. 4810]|nr:hypothetical protein [Rhodoferax jenense]
MLTYEFSWKFCKSVPCHLPLARARAVGFAVSLGCSCTVRWVRALFLVVCMLCGVDLALSATLSPPLQPVREPRFESVGAGAIPRDVVPTFVQDQAGWFWIGTGDGLVRFDGYSFRPQLKDSPDPAARNLGWVQSMLAGRDGRVWIGTETDGLAVYDPAKDKIVMIGGEGAPPVEPQAGAKQRSLPTIRALAEDQDGAIYIGSLGGGLERLDPKSMLFTRYRHADQAGSLPSDQVRSLLVDRSGTLWIGTWAGLGKRLKGSERFEVVLPNHAALGGHAVTALFEASDGRIWVGTQDGAVVVVDPQSPHASHTLASDVGALKGAVTSLVEAPGHRMWVGRIDGIQIVDVVSLQPVQQLQHDARRPSGLAGNEVTTLLTDQAGWIWVGGFGLGLQRHNPNNRSIWMRGPDLSNDSPLRNADVRSILQLQDGAILAATHNGPVAVLDQGFRAVSEINLVNAAAPAVLKGSSQLMAASPAPVRVEAMAQTLDRMIWLGSGSQVYQFTPQRRYVRAISHRSGQTRRLLASSHGSLWVGTEVGVYRLVSGGTALEPVKQPDGEAFKQEIHALTEGPDGDIWLGTTAGLYRVAAGGLVASPVPLAADKALSSTIVIGML